MATACDPTNKLYLFSPDGSSQAKALQPHPILDILVLIHKADLYKFRLDKSVFTIKRENETFKFVHFIIITMK